MFRAENSFGKYEYFVVVYLSFLVEVMFPVNVALQGLTCKSAGTRKVIMLWTLGAVMSIAAMQCMSETGVS
jgi:hypothetical protein